MKIKTLVWGLILIAWACTTEVELIAPGDPVPVVYCLLDPEDSVQYVRLGRTYSVQPGDTGFRPSQEDILVDGEILVYLAAEYADNRQEIFYAVPVDTIPKDSGWFPSDANQLYAISCRIKPGTRYSLYILFQESNRIIHGETVSLGSGFNLIDPDLVPGREATLLNGIDYFVRFDPVVGGPVFQSTMTFRYAEISDGRRTDRALVIPQKFGFVYDTTLSYGELRISGERFLIDISRSIRPESGTWRIPLGLDFHVSCGGEDLALKISAENNTQSFSILDVNSFDNAIGVFSCLVHRYVRDVPISHFTVDTLAMGALTRGLGFLTSRQIDSLHYETR